MCGIAGMFRFDRTPLDVKLLEAMTRSLAHRGPDEEGYVLLASDGKSKPVAVVNSLSNSVREIPPEYGVGLGHRRLAVLDLSPLGRQPMASEDGLIWITYNGEVYNYLEIRRELMALGRRFRSVTDTEVVLQAYEEWGIPCLERLNGMFAFAVWDGGRNRLFCARDRLGMKPFYYRVGSNRLIFASEIKALLEDPLLKSSPNVHIIYDFLVLNLQDHTDETFFEGIRQLSPGHFLLAERDKVHVEEWWNVRPRPSQRWSGECTPTAAFTDLFRDAVRIHLRSDVPVGSCLSGGLDSSSIVCTLRQCLPSSEIQTFSAYFKDRGCDERPYIRAVASKARTKCVEIMPDERRLLAEMPAILRAQEEPFAGTSYLAQWEIMRAASQQGVKVLLDGQGGDELLCGYPGYWGSYVGDLIRSGFWRKACSEGSAYIRQQGRLHPTVVSNLARAVLPAHLVSDVRFGLKRHALWLDPDFCAAHRSRDHAGLSYSRECGTALDNHIASYLRTHSLPALLHHEDRSSMAFSVEARLPFLDSNVVEFLLGAPPELKLSRGRSKAILRDALAGVLPPEVAGRVDKMGFSTPQDRWLRETWRPELEILFSSPSFEQRGYWDPKQLRKAYERYCRGEIEIGSSVWRWVCLELWHQRFFS
ncbi:Asparagine synthetase (glutamine-hydrolyzing) [Nitrospira tepida]|uniref:asparagine synthase (glutamine-hydrolyzing) n=1 Tax=Nitrospira tepida TaxID=2973512 RepID=A0AA86N1Y5_9BACT|nr:asparagine synthase (glutamine-hydrolyzing) [Nitrospira tepida]CAI4033174.1 Asparagine synthetase (glutamine-hydrolyzing) [Nitrospira tepida]